MVWLKIGQDRRADRVPLLALNDVSRPSTSGSAQRCQVDRLFDAFLLSRLITGPICAFIKPIAYLAVKADSNAFKKVL